MPWQRQTRKSYYTRRRRVDGRIITEYLGRSRAAALASAADQERAALRAQQLAEERADRDFYEHFKARLDEIDVIVRALTTATLLVSGYHLHHRQWRKNRAPTKRPPT